MTERECASFFLRAFDYDNIRLWLYAAREWKDSPTRVGKATESLRKAFFHDGSDEARDRCKRAAERLRRALATPDSAQQGEQE